MKAYINNHEFELNKEQTHVNIDGELIEVLEDQEGGKYIMENGKAVYFDHFAHDTQPKEVLQLIAGILDRKRKGNDCTEEESAELKMFIKETKLPGSGEQQLIEDIQLLFPLEYGEALDEMEREIPVSTKEVLHTQPKSNNHTDISGHDISWYVEDDTVNELTDFEIERIKELIKDGFSSGELNMCIIGDEDDTTRGWWHIVNWQDIALELYNACPNKTDQQKKARKRFDENWD